LIKDKELPIQLTAGTLDEISWKAVDPSIYNHRTGTAVFRMSLEKFTAVQVENFFRQITHEEQDKANRYIKASDRKRYILTHYYLRQLLSQYTQIAPLDLAIEKGKHDKPFLASHPDLCFNLSHSHEFVVFAIAFAPHQTIGVDIEKIDLKIDYPVIIDNYFTKTEQTQIHDPATFFLLWTRKEALLKAAGSGLTQGILDLTVLDGTQDVSTADPELESLSSGQWRIYSFEFAPEYFCSVAKALEDVEFCFYEI